MLGICSVSRRSGTLPWYLAFKSFSLTENSSYNFGKGIALSASTNFYPPFNKLLRYMIPRKIRQKIVDHKAMSNEKVQKRLSLAQKRPDFIDTITTQNEGKGERAMTLKEIELNMSILVFAGSETTASALSGIIRMLLQNRAAMAILKSEIGVSFKAESDITIGSVGRLAYLDAVIEEGMRLCPPVTIGVPRIIPTPGDEVCDYWIPENVSYIAEHFSAVPIPLGTSWLLIMTTDLCHCQSVSNVSLFPQLRSSQ